MTSLSRREFLGWSLATAGVVCAGETAWAEPDWKSEVISPRAVTGQDRVAQPGIWALEVRLKPVRMVEVEVKDAKTGKAKREVVWYLCYRAFNRVGDGWTPSEDTPKAPMFVPEVTLLTEFKGKTSTYLDSVVLAAQQAINTREKWRYKNAVEIIGPVPDALPAGQKGTSLDGIACWRGVDPNTDRFRVFLSGFSNGYIVGKDPDGKEIVQRKTLVQEFWRPGDQFEIKETEIRRSKDPVWLFR